MKKVILISIGIIIVLGLSLLSFVGTNLADKLGLPNELVGIKELKESISNSSGSLEKRYLPFDLVSARHYEPILIRHDFDQFSYIYFTEKGEPILSNSINRLYSSDNKYVLEFPTNEHGGLNLWDLEGQLVYQICSHCGVSGAYWLANDGFVVWSDISPGQLGKSQDYDKYHKQISIYNLKDKTVSEYLSRGGVEFADLKNISDAAKKETILVPPKDTLNWKVSEDRYHGYQFKYPSDFQAYSINEPYEGRVCVPSKDMEVCLDIAVKEGAQPTGNCSNKNLLFGAQTASTPRVMKEEIRINGLVFTKSSFSYPAYGHRLTNFEYYSLVKDGVCYSLELTASSLIGKEFDAEPLLGKLREVVATFTLISKEPEVSSILNKIDVLNADYIKVRESYRPNLTNSKFFNGVYPNLTIGELRIIDSEEAGVWLAWMEEDKIFLGDFNGDGPKEAVAIVYEHALSGTGGGASLFLFGNRNGEAYYLDRFNVETDGETDVIYNLDKTNFSLEGKDIILKSVDSYDYYSAKQGAQKFNVTRKFRMVNNELVQLDKKMIPITN